MKKASSLVIHLTVGPFISSWPQMNNIIIANYPTPKAPCGWEDYAMAEEACALVRFFYNFHFGNIRTFYLPNVSQFFLCSFAHQKWLILKVLETSEGEMGQDLWRVLKRAFSKIGGHTQGELKIHKFIFLFRVATSRRWNLLLQASQNSEPGLILSERDKPRDKGG